MILNFCDSRFIAFIIVTFVSSPLAWAWGERGHHLVGRNAAFLMADMATKEDKAKGIAAFYRSRANQLGHLANIPDISWKEASLHTKMLISSNSPNHYIDLELLVGKPGKDAEAYKKSIRNISVDYKAILEKYDGSDSPLPGTPEKYKKTRVFSDVGTAPWRVRELYEAMTLAFECAKAREEKSDLRKERENFKLPFKSGTTPPSVPYYTCEKEQTRLQALAAAFTLGGVMGHYIGDLAQPYHITVDFDGWVNGNGKAHEYFESSIVDEFTAKLEAEVFAKAQSSDIKKEVEKELTVKWGEKGAAAAFSLNLAANSWFKLDDAIALDTKYAVTKPGTKVPLGDKAFLFDREKYKPATRKAASDKIVVKKFKPLIVERLAIGSRALATIWYQAWTAGGKPNLADLDPISIPYTLDVPFLWPTYDPEALVSLSKK